MAFPRIVEENESTRGIAWIGKNLLAGANVPSDAGISQQAHRQRCEDEDRQHCDENQCRPLDGITRRTQSRTRRCHGELLEPSAIALNLIEVASTAR